jgi:heme/copper-type cytochrome/quinol oxidase subunit 2
VQQGSDSLMNLVWQTSSTILTVLAVVMSLIATGLVMYGLYVKFWKYREAKPIRDYDDEVHRRPGATGLTRRGRAGRSTRPFRKLRRTR